MRPLAILILLVVIGGGLAMAYVTYRQMETKIVTLVAANELVDNGQGARCGDLRFVVEARSVGRWTMLMEQGQTLSGFLAVEGEERDDIALRVWSPSNRTVLLEPTRRHRHEIELAAQVRGDYRFEFDNRHSGFTDKHIVLSACLK